MTDSSDSMFCNACQFSITSVDQRINHYKSEWHRYNVKRRVAGLQSIPQALFNNQLSLLQEKKDQNDKEKTKQVCTVCNKTFQSISAYQVHLQSKKHIKKQQSKGLNNNQNIDNDDNDDDESTDNTEATVIVKKPNSTSSTNNIEQKVSATNDLKSDENNEDEDADFDPNDPLADMDESAAIPILTCLFCRNKYEESDKQNYLDHMLKQHGFFIPFVEYLTDLDGFLTYLGEKIGIGRVCIWCNGRGRARFPTVSAVQQHMNNKSHCKIRLDTPEEEEEFLDYYSFPKDEEDEEEEEEEEDPIEEKKNPVKTKASYDLPESITGIKSTDKTESSKNIENNSNTTESTSTNTESQSNETNSTTSTNKTKRRLAGMNDLGELVLTDGSTVGHRAYKNQYKINYKPAPTKESVLINQLATSYRMLALTDGSTNNSNALSLINNTKKDAPSRFRESWYQNHKRKNDLAVGLVGNIQHHFRAQIQF